MLTKTPVLAASVFLVTFLAASPVLAEGGKGGHHGMHGVAQLDAGASGKSGCKHGGGKDGGGKHGMKHGKGHGQGHGMGGHGGKKHHGGCKKHGAMAHGDKAGKHMYGPDWRQSLTGEQKAELDRLHLQYARTKAPLKAGVKAMEVRLAVLATSDNPNMEQMEGPMMDLLLAKQEMMRAKFNYIAAQRKVLTPQQRVSFDMDVIHKTMHGDVHKKSKGGHGKH